jgi:predicted RNA-binding protein YlxR (DUF448 family)
MRKESVNYKSEGSVVVKRSPSNTGKKSSYAKRDNKSIGKWVKRDAMTGAFRKSMTDNINSIGRLLNESEKIMPRPQNN